MRTKLIYFGAGKNGEDIEKPIKNLGWLLRNWKNINYLFIHKKEGLGHECELMASIQDSDCLYHTEFASYQVCLRILDRPIFRDLSIIIKESNNAESPYKVGSKEYRQLIKV